jgi:hypothetical protein
MIYTLTPTVGIGLPTQPCNLGRIESLRAPVVPAHHGAAVAGRIRAIR